MMFNSKDKELITLAARAVRIANMGIPVMGISLIVLDRDLSKVKNEDLDKVKVECTIKSGELIFNRL